MPAVARVHLPSEIPIVGCELDPYVLLRLCNDAVVSADDVSESRPIDGCFIRYKWYRIQSDLKICSIHPGEEAQFQCLGCVKAKVPDPKSYHCSTKCFLDNWQYHCFMHEQAERAAKTGNENRPGGEEFLTLPNNRGVAVNTYAASQSPGYYRSSTPSHLSGSVLSRNELYVEVGQHKAYTPTADDIGQVLKFECLPIDLETRIPMGVSQTVLTSRVIPSPAPIPRRLFSVGKLGPRAHIDSDKWSLSTGTFVVLSYNILSESYATSEMYSYCPSWALSWSYRRQNLLREIISYNADIICLQEVQSNHFEEFFSPELDKHGFQALFKSRTSEPNSGSAPMVDGCATFFRRDRFSHVKKYEVEFNKAARVLTDCAIQPHQKKSALERLHKDNVALIVVLEAKSNSHCIDPSAGRQLLCVANTHTYVQQDLQDVKLWQVHTLLRGLEKISSSAEIPILVCGDFSSSPGSAPHSLLARGKVDPRHPDLSIDPLGILHPTTKLTHRLPLVSAYSSFARIMGVDMELAKQKRMVDSSTNEPLFTHITRDFIGTHDYIFYTADTLIVESLLELLDEDSLRKNTAIPSPEWSSDHLALLAEFRCIRKTKC